MWITTGNPGNKSWVSWHTSVTSVLRQCQKKSAEFKSILGYIKEKKKKHE